MPEMVCPNCDGTGRVEDATGETVVCPMCEGTGVLITEDDATSESDG
jgi:DnaJ-class molecular chaperone